MPKITGKLTDFGFDVMPGSAPKLVFKFVTPGGPTSGVAGTSILANRDVIVSPAYNGYFEADLETTAKISPAGYYQLTLEWKDRNRLVRRDVLPWRLYVPAEGGVLADLLRVPSNPALVFTGPTPPANPSPGSWWLETATGDLSEYGRTGWTLKTNLRGPAGYNGTGAAEDLQTLADYVTLRPGTSNAFFEALVARFARLDILPVNVRSVLYGADPTGGTDAAPAISAALRLGNRDVYIPAGRYLLKSALRLYSNTKVVMHPDAVLLNDNQTHEYTFVNGELGNASHAAGYTGAGNLWISGGQLDQSPRAGRQQPTQAICIGHAENVLIENVRMSNNFSSHFIEINSTRRAMIRGCGFKNLNPGGATSREAINVDYSYEQGFPAFGGWDGTNVDGLTVTDCDFDGVQVGVGSHSDKVPAHRNIAILGNRFRNISAAAVYGKGWHEARITGNTFSSVGTSAVWLEACEWCTATGNTTENIGIQAHNTHNVFVASGGSNNTLGPNHIPANTHANKYGVAYWAKGSGAHTIDTTGADAGSWSRTHSVDVGNNGTVVDGVTTYQIKDDGTAVFHIPTPEAQGLVMVTMHSDQDFAPRGLYWVRAFENPAALTVPIVRPAGAVDAARLNITAGALTGTTGPDGTVSLSADGAGNLYVENRTGTQRRVGIRWLGSAF